MPALQHFDPVIFRPGYNNVPQQIPAPVPGDPQTQTSYPTTPTLVSSPTWNFAAGTSVTVSYIEAGASVTAESESKPLPPIRIFLGQNAAGPIVPGSLRFTFRGKTYVDRSGTLVYDVDPLTNAGINGGTIDYANCRATLTGYGAGSSTTVTIVSLLTRYAEPGVSGVFFRTAGAPLREGSFTVRATTITGTLITGSADVNGKITGTKMLGKVDWQAGTVRIAFGEMVTAAGNEAQPWYDAALIVSGQIWKPEMIDPATVFFGTVIYHSIPADPAIIGIDPVRLPSDGRVPAYQPGKVIVIHHTQTTTVASPVAAAVHDLGRTNLTLIEVFDADGDPVESVWYTADLDAGTLTWANPLNLSAYTLPIKIRDRIEHATQCADVQITGEIGLQSPLPRAFPAGTLISSAIAIGDMRARVSLLFDQQTYSAGVWKDVVEGSPAGATYNDVNYPIVVTNRSALDERWAIVFTAPTIVNVIGETVGQVLTGVSIGSDIAPVNPVSGQPYFTIPAAGWGGGWAAGNVLRSNTVSATKPLWALRTTLQGEITELTDSVRIQAYGNAH